MSTAKLKKFCNKSCAAVYNNKKVPKRHKIEEPKKDKNKGPALVFMPKMYCDVCGDLITLKKRGNRYISRKRCDICKHTKIGVSEAPTDYVTKGELFKKRKNWQSARSTIRKRAYIVYKRSGKPKKCLVCGYDKTFQVIHLKSVSSFTDAALISEINAIDNLEALCLKCHWEYDKGILDIKKYLS